MYCRLCRYCFAAMVFENCIGDQTSRNFLTSPEFTLLSDQELTFTMLFTSSGDYSNMNVYTTSILGCVDTLLGSYSSADPNVTHSVCLPAGTYQLVFIASAAENVAKSTVMLTEVLLTNSFCTRTSLAGNL